MQPYLNQGIKGIIRQFPAVENILNDYNIGCAPCNAGACLLKDIIDIHNLSPGDEEFVCMDGSKISGAEERSIAEPG